MVDILLVPYSHIHKLHISVFSGWEAGKTVLRSGIDSEGLKGAQDSINPRRTEEVRGVVLASSVFLRSCGIRRFRLF